MTAFRRQAVHKDWLPPKLPSARQAFGDPAFWISRPRRIALCAVAYFVAHGLLVLAGMALADDPAHIPLYPAAGLLLSVFLVTPRRTWPLWVTGAMGGALAAYAIAGSPWSTSIDFVAAVAHVVGPAIAAVLIVPALVQALQYRRPLYFYVMVSLGAITAAVIAAVAVVSLRAAPSQLEWVALWRAEILGIYFGITFVLPLIVSVTVASRRVHRYRMGVNPEFIGWTVFLAACLYLTLTPLAGFDVNASHEQRLTAYALLGLPCVWAALRFDARATSVALACVAVGLILATDQATALVPLQWYLLGLVQIIWLFAVAVLERTRTEEDQQVRRTIEGMLMRLSSRFALADTDELDDLILATVSDIGGFTEADRCALIVIDRAHGEYRESHAWTRRAGVRTALVSGPLADFSWTVEQLEATGSVVLSDTRHTDKRAAQEFERVFGEGAGTAAYSALRFEGEIIGAAGFIWRGRRTNYSADMIALLHIFAQLFTSLLRRRQAETELQSYQEKLRAMARALSLSEERARRQAALDLHDGIGQNLALVKITLQQMSSRGPAQPEQLLPLCDLIEETLQQSRFVIADLSPSVLYDLGFGPAVKWLAARGERRNPHVAITVEETGEAWELTEDSRVALFRSVRELLQNALRHSQADSISIHVDWRADDLHVCVSDNGVGFEREVALQPGPLRDGNSFGLFSVAEAVRSYGGEVVTNSLPGEGAAVSFSARRELAAAGVAATVEEIA